MKHASASPSETASATASASPVPTAYPRSRTSPAKYPSQHLCPPSSPANTSPLRPSDPAPRRSAPSFAPLTLSLALPPRPCYASRVHRVATYRSHPDCRRTPEFPELAPLTNEPRSRSEERRCPQRRRRVSMSRLDHLKHFYGSLSMLEDRIGGARRLSDTSGRMSWPRRGIYFFTEPGEARTETGDGPRIVRVGTHAVTAGSNSKLWDRLYHHRGPAKSGHGNHRGSVFRDIVGKALIERDALDYPSWGIRNSHGSALPKGPRTRASLGEGRQ